MKSECINQGKFTRPAANSAPAQSDADYEITIRRFGKATIQGPNDPLLFLLASPQTTFEQGAPHGHQQSVSPQLFWAIDPDGRVRLSPGLVPYVTSCLTELGHSVRVTDRRKPSTRMKVNRHPLKRADELQRQIGEAMADNYRGQIALRDKDELMRSLAIACRMFPGANILIMTATMQQAREIWISLRKLMSWPVQFARGKWYHRNRIVVCPYTFIQHPRHWDVVIFADAETMTSERALDRIKTMLPGKKRIYGFRHADSRPGRRDDLIMQAIAGPVIYSSQVRRAAVYVLVCPIDSFPRAEKLQGLARKRTAIWMNDRRNQAFAAIADGLARRDRAKLREYGLRLDDEEESLDREGDPLRVCILVESSEHAGQLKKLLPAWKVLDAHGGDASSGPPGTGMIVTMTYAAMHAIDADIIIRADTGPLQIKGFPPAASETKSGQVILIDIDDEFDKFASRQTQQRLDEYAQRGWYTAGARRYRAINGYSRLPRIFQQEAAKMVSAGGTFATTQDKEDSGGTHGVRVTPHATPKNSATIVSGSHRHDAPVNSQAEIGALSSTKPDKSSRTAAVNSANTRDDRPSPADTGQRRHFNVIDSDHTCSGNAPTVQPRTSNVPGRIYRGNTPDPCRIA